MGAHFETFIDDAGAARWRLVGGNGEKIAASEAYVSDDNAERGIRDAQAAVLHTLEDEILAVLRQVDGAKPEHVLHHLLSTVGGR